VDGTHLFTKFFNIYTAILSMTEVYASKTRIDIRVGVRVRAGLVGIGAQYSNLIMKGVTGAGNP